LADTKLQSFRTKQATSTTSTSFTPTTNTSLFTTSNANTSFQTTDATKTTKTTKTSTQSQNNAESKSKSLALCCQSPDALSIHSLIKNNSTIQTKTLPLNHESSITVHTQLPSWLISSFDIDAPCEILCVDNDTTISTTLKSSLLSKRIDGGGDGDGDDGTNGSTENRKTLLPLLCIYTMKAIYILQLSASSIEASKEEPNNIYSKDDDNDDDNDDATIVYRGQLESIHEPLESYLYTQKEENHEYNFFIQRVRSAPYNHCNGGNMYNMSPFIPRGCIAVLLSTKKKQCSTYKFIDDSDDDSDDDDYIDKNSELSFSQLVLYHGVDNEHDKRNDGHQLLLQGDDQETMRHRLKKSKNNIKGKEERNLTIIDMNTLDPLVDFTFMSNIMAGTSLSSSSSSSSFASALWNGLSVALSTNEGEIYTMTPIVFHGMAIPQQLLQDALYHLKNTENTRNSEHNNEQESNDNNCNILTSHNNAKNVLYKRNMATVAYIKDVFGVALDDHRSYSSSNSSSDNIQHTPSKKKRQNKKRSGSSSCVVTANVFNHPNRERNAASWPIAIQGPVYTPSDPCTNEVACLECLPPPTGSFDSFGFTNYLVLARGRTGQCIQYIMIPSGINCIPRFAFENGHDCDQLNELVDNTGIMLEEISLEDSSSDDTGDDEYCTFNFFDSIRDGQTARQNVIVHVDPIDNNMIHHFSKYGVVTITTNAMKVMSNHLNSFVTKNSIDNQETKSKVWSTIDIVNEKLSERVVGVNISGDAKVGHILLAALSNGTLML
jgi:hypothetical protein